MYTTEVRVFVMGGGTPNPSTLNAALFLLETTIDSENVAHDHDENKETIAAATSPSNDPFFVKAGLSFRNGPSFFLAGDTTRQIAFTVSDPRFSGSIFRSGAQGTLPDGFPQDPNGFIEVVLPEPISISIAGPVPGMFPAAIPGVPGGRVTAGTITAGDGSFTLVLVGTVAVGVRFTYTAVYGVAPSKSVRDAREIATLVRMPGPRVPLVFAGGSPLAVVEAALLNFLEPIFLPQVASAVADRINDAIFSKALDALDTVFLTPNMTTRSRSSVTVCCQGVTLRASDTNDIMVAVGNFGRMSQPAQQGTSSGCALSQAKMLVLPMLQLDVFRRFRDEVLSHNPLGRDCIALYRAYGGEIMERILADPELTAAASQLAGDAEVELTRDGSLSATVLGKLAAILAVLMPRCSPALRRDFANVLSSIA